MDYNTIISLQLAGSVVNWKPCCVSEKVSKAEYQIFLFIQTKSFLVGFTIFRRTQAGCRFTTKFIVYQALNFIAFTQVQYSKAFKLLITLCQDPCNFNELRGCKLFKCNLSFRVVFVIFESAKKKTSLDPSLFELYW